VSGTPTHRAMLVGNARFQEDPERLGPLATPAGDVAGLVDALTDERHGLHQPEDVSVQLDKPRDWLLRAIGRFLRAARPDDQLLLAYSGHAIADDRHRLYLCASDTMAQFPFSTALPADVLATMLDVSAAAAVVVLLDCCYSGSFARAATGPPAARLAGRRRYVLANAHDLGSAAGPATRNSGALTGALVAGLLAGEQADTSRDGLLSLEELWSFVCARLDTAGEPAPRRFFDGPGTVVLARAPGPPPGEPAAPAPPPGEVVGPPGRPDLPTDGAPPALEAVPVLPVPAGAPGAGSDTQAPGRPGVRRPQRKSWMDTMLTAAQRREIMGWELEFESVRQESPLAAALLELCAFLDTRGIPVGLLAGAGDVLPPELGTSTQEPRTVDAAIAVLEEHGLVARSGDLLTVPRLVQFAVRSNLGPEHGREWSGRALTLIAQALSPEGVQAGQPAWAHPARLLVHAEAVAAHAHALGVPIEELPSVLDAIGTHLWSVGKAAGARPWFERALEVNRRLYGPVDRKVANAMEKLASVYREVGEVTRADRLHHDAVAMGSALDRGLVRARNGQDEGDPHTDPGQR
jgi:Caspase domain/Tetratricopeptide repeat